MKTIPPISNTSPGGLGKRAKGAAHITSSAAHHWRGTLALDIVGSATGECRNDHVRVALQLWWQPLSVRPLRGLGSWRTLEAGARLWLPGEQQYFQWRQAVHTSIVLILPERIEQILERPYSKVKLDAWRGLDFRSSFVSRLVAAMTDDLANHCPAGPIVGDSLTTALVAHLDAGPRQVTLAESHPGPSQQAFERMLQYVEDHLAEPLRMPQLAKEAGCSPKHLNRAFRERRGMLPHQYVLARRVERAGTMIDTGRFSLAQVAATVGFADQSQMTKTFRKLTGTTPSRFRQRSHDRAGAART